MAWQQPLTIRTAQHVESRHPRCGILGAEGFNRIEGNTAYLAGLLELELETYTGWNAGSLVFERDMRRVCEGLGMVRERSLIAHPSEAGDGWMPAVPALPLNNIEKLNRVETIQLRALRAANAGREGWRVVEADGVLGNIL